MNEKTTVKAGDIVRYFDGKLWVCGEHHKAAIERAYENGKAVGMATEHKACAQCHQTKGST
jgi:hypothetical protein